MPFLLVACAAFVLSGAAGLVYEVLWTRYLGLLVGHTAYAQVIVLSVFLGGMGIGALVAGARSARLADPLKWYARIELFIGILGFTFDPMFRWLTRVVFDVLLPATGSGAAGMAATWIVASLTILLPSLLLGTTFPLLSAGVLRREASRAGRVIALLYAANSGGAAVGALGAGFLLIPALGLPGAILTAATLNVAAGMIAYLLSGQQEAEPAIAVHGPAAGGSLAVVGPVLLTVAAGTAVASFLYEVAWIRMLSLLLSSATHSFEIMLSAFILGLAAGAFWVRRGADSWHDPVRALGIIQVVMGCAALATLPLYHAAFGWVVGLMQTFGRTDGGYVGFSVGRYAICLAIMLPATFCAGATLPLITRALLTHRQGEAAIGHVYGVNTLGSIAGIVLAALVLLPAIGLKAMLLAGAALDVALGILVLATAPVAATRRFAPAGLAIGLLAVGAASVAPDFDRELLASGVFRTGRLPPPNSLETLYHEDGRTATVTVGRLSRSRQIVIATNGKPDGSLPEAWLAPCVPDSTPAAFLGDVATQALAPLITLAHRPDAVDAVVIGFGSGMSSHLLLAASPTLASLVTVEIEPAMARAARAFLPANRLAYEDPRSVLIAEDARAYFARTRRRFDLIFSEPSNPWVAGVSSLFTTEFYAQVRAALTDTGVFGQWLHLYEFNDRLVQSVLAAVHAHFPSYAVYQADATNILIVASAAPALRPPDWSLIFDARSLQADLCHVVPVTGAMLDASRIAERSAFAPLLDGGEGANSDYYPILDLGAERARYLHQRAAGLVELAAARFDFLAAIDGSHLGWSTDTVAPVPDIPRQQAQAIAASLRHHTGGAAEQGNPRARARYLLSRWNRGLDGAAPEDWIAWLADFEQAERLVHGATRGVADEEFYARVERFLDRTAAPVAVRETVQFRHGLARWDFPMVRDAAIPLAREPLPGSPVTPRTVLEGLVTAHLLLGEIDAADSTFGALAAWTRPEEVDLRLLLLGAHVRRAREVTAASTR